MPRLFGTHKLLGTTNDMTYQKTKDGWRAKSKIAISGDRFKTAAGYARVRENMAEFSRAGKAGKLFRQAFSAVVGTVSDGRMSSRLTTAFLRIIKTDPVSDRGERSLLLGDLGSAAGFNFNAVTDFTTVFHPPYTAAVNRATGQATLTIPAFRLGDGIDIPEGASHARIFAGAALLDFEALTYVSDIKYAAEIDLGVENVAAITLSPQVTAASTQPLFIVVGIQYYLSTNGKLYPLNKSFNAMGLVKVDIDETP